MHSLLGLLFVVVPLAVAQNPDPRDLVSRAVAAEARNGEVARNYTFLQRTEERDLDPNGKVKSKSSRTYDVTMLAGSAYRRLIERDDRPLPAAEEKREQEKLRQSIEERKRETESQRAQRLAEYEKRPMRDRGMMKEIPEAFDFRLRGEETIESRPAYVIDATPRPEYRPRNAQAKILLPNLKATFWIDKADLNWVRMDAEVIDNISFGWLLFRLSKGAHFRMDRTRWNNEVWLPGRIDVAGSARLALLKKFNLEQEHTFRNYRKFQSDSAMLPALLR